MILIRMLLMMMVLLMLLAGAMVGHVLVAEITTIAVVCRHATRTIAVMVVPGTVLFRAVSSILYLLNGLDGC